MTRMRRKRWLILIGLGAITLFVVAAGLILVWQGSSAPTERLRNTTEIQEAIFLAASNDYFDHISRRPVLEPNTHAIKMLDENQVWLAPGSIQMLNQVCTGAKSVRDVYQVEATIRLEMTTTTVYYRGEAKGKATYWLVHIDRLKHCRLGN